MTKITDPKVRTVDADNTIVIETGLADSEAFNTKGTSILGFYLPSNWTDCELSFFVAYSSDPDAEFFQVAAEGVPYQVPTTDSIFLAIPTYIFAPCRQVKLRCNVVQANTVEIKLALAPLFS